MDNVDSYMQELQTIVTERPKENESLVAKAKDIASRMNYDSLLSPWLALSLVYSHHNPQKVSTNCSVKFCQNTPQFKNTQQIPSLREMTHILSEEVEHYLS